MSISIEHTITLSDPAVRWKYANSFADVRFGQVLEDLDLITARIAWQYAEGPVVTAALEQLDFVHPINMEKNLLCKAALNMVGKSSLEVGVRLENEGNHIASAYFTFVAVDEKGKTRRVKSYVPQIEEEIRRENAARQRKEQYQQKNLQEERHFFDEELELLAQAKKSSGTYMYRGANIMSMYPQQTNPHHTIFGGHLMHLGLELAADSIYEYSGQRAVLASINRINFLRPVPIGALLKMHHTVCYVGNTSAQVEILFEELHGKNPQPITNSCYFAFVSVDEQFKPKQMPKVIPATPQEEKKFVEGYRRYKHHKERRGN
ncbi:hypothetical protein HYX13_03690 [Candidatus Woesearchaeota archaeon]|nr:hypothetical protein [Candidatus Woesearchaeota archaeon]